MFLKALPKKERDGTMKFSVCTDSVFSELETDQAMREVDGLGIQQVEFWSWWDKDIPAINQTRQELNMEIKAICTKFISLTDPSQRESYLKGLAETIEVANLLECRTIISQVGDRTNDTDKEQEASIVTGLRQAGELLKDSMITLVIEPLNIKIDHPDYFLWSSDQANEIITQVNHPQIKMLYDFYHQQIMEGDLIRQSTRFIEQIGHVHMAGHPGRHELEIGEINYQAILTNLAAIKYAGGIGLEYFPIKEKSKNLQKWQEFIGNL